MRKLLVILGIIVFTACSFTTKPVVQTEAIQIRITNWKCNHNFGKFNRVVIKTDSTIIVPDLTLGYRFYNIIAQEKLTYLLEDEHQNKAMFFFGNGKILLTTPTDVTLFSVKDTRRI